MVVRFLVVDVNLLVATIVRAIATVVLLAEDDTSSR
jgi:hypothetical protein